MSIGICDLIKSKARVLGFALVCGASLSACSSGNGAGLSFAPKSAAKGNAVQTGPSVPHSAHAKLARGAITIKAPKGYCIDTTSITKGLQGSSAMLARCTSLQGKGASQDAAVMSVSISPRRGEDAPNVTTADLAQAVAPRKILAHKQRGNLALVQVASGGHKVFSAADPVHWRGATSLDTRIILLGLFAPDGSPLKGKAGGDLLTSLASGISATRGSLLGLNKPLAGPSDAPSRKVQPKAVQKTISPDTVELEKKGASGLIARLLNRS